MLRSGLAQHHLPQLSLARTEEPGTTKQVIPPATPELSWAIARQILPVYLEVAAPGLQGALIVLSEVLPVFDQEQTLQAAAELTGRRQTATGEHMGIDPVIAAMVRAGPADGLEQGEAMSLRRPTCSNRPIEAMRSKRPACSSGNWR